MLDNWGGHRQMDRRGSGYGYEDYEEHEGFHHVAAHHEQHEGHFDRHGNHHGLLGNHHRPHHPLAHHEPHEGHLDRHGNLHRHHHHPLAHHKPASFFDEEDEEEEKIVESHQHHMMKQRYDHPPPPLNFMPPPPMPPHGIHKMNDGRSERREESYQEVRYHERHGATQKPVRNVYMSGAFGGGGPVGKWPAAASGGGSWRVGGYMKAGWGHKGLD